MAKKSYGLESDLFRSLRTRPKSRTAKFSSHFQIQSLERAERFIHTRTALTYNFHVYVLSLSAEDNSRPRNNFRAFRINYPCQPPRRIPRAFRPRVRNVSPYSTRWSLLGIGTLSKPIIRTKPFRHFEISSHPLKFVSSQK